MATPQNNSYIDSDQQYTNLSFQSQSDLRKARRQQMRQQSSQSTKNVSNIRNQSSLNNFKYDENRQYLKPFNLSNQENVIVYSKCNLRQSVNIQGYCIITDNYLCFQATALGIKKQVVLDLSLLEKIKRIQTSSELHEIITEDDETEQLTLKIYMRRQEDIPSSNQDSSQNKSNNFMKNMLMQKLENSMKQMIQSEIYYLNEIKKFHEVFQHLKQRIERNIAVPLQGKQNQDQAVVSKSDIIRDEKEVVTESINSTIDLALYSKVDLKNTIKSNRAQSLPRLTRNYSKFRLDQTVINNQSSQIVQKDITTTILDTQLQKFTLQDLYPPKEPTDEDLITQAENFLFSFKTDQDWKFLDQAIIPLTLVQAFNQFFADSAPFGMNEFFQQLNRKNIEIDKEWSLNHSYPQLAKPKSIISQNFTNQSKIKSKLVKLTIPVKGVPFLSESRHEKYMKIVNQNDNCIIVDMENRTLDVPYSDAFIVHERWVLFSTHKDVQQTLLRVMMSLEFVKSSLFKVKITNKSEEGMKENTIQWLQYAKEGGHFNKQTIKTDPKIQAQENKQLRKLHKRSKSADYLENEQQITSQVGSLNVQQQESDQMQQKSNQDNHQTQICQHQIEHFDTQLNTQEHSFTQEHQEDMINSIEQKDSKLNHDLQNDQNIKDSEIGTTSVSSKIFEQPNSRNLREISKIMQNLTLKRNFVLLDHIPQQYLYILQLQNQTGL
eukprot:403376851